MSEKPDRVTPTHGIVKLGEVALHYMEAGAGDPVVLIHGFPQNCTEWEGVMARLAPHYRVVAPDLRGMGDSSRPTSGYDLKTVAQDIADFIKALGLQVPRIVGHDLGAPVAFFLAADPSLNVRQLAYMEAPLYGVDVEGLAGLASHLWHLNLFPVPDIPEFLLSGRETEFIGYFMKMAAYDKGAITPELVSGYARAMRLPGALRAMLAYYQAIPGNAEQVEQVRARGRLTMPVLALGGEASLGEIPLRQMREVADDVRGGVVQRCGHWIPEERPDELVQRLQEFFSEG